LFEIAKEKEFSIWCGLIKVGRVALLEKGGSEEPSRPSKRAGSSVQEDNFFANMDENSAGEKNIACGFVD